ncbi:MAG: hypothetical protein F6J97_25950, partial [Leptolyngbya sp. SIO4C1]|nr:hypothetical protein [Leptolyngbya sp. SIO4C1]
PSILDCNQIQAFLNARGVVLSCDRIAKVHYGRTPFYFEAINCDLKQVKEQLEPLQLHLGLSEAPTAEIEQGKVKLVAQLSQESAPVTKTELKLVDAPLSRLEAAINDSIHLRVVAPSGSGKTVLLGNLINYLANTLQLDYVLSDPKVTDPENWGNLKPTYYSAECLVHFFSLTETALVRIDEAARWAKAGKGQPSFEPQFHILDELEFLYGLSEISGVKDFNPKMFKINAKTMLKVGREHKLKLLFVTQSPLPSDLNLRRNDFENCSSIFLGSAISEALNQTHDEGLLRDVPNELIAKLKAEYRARLSRDDKWIYLFFNPVKPHDVFFGRCPSPGHYAMLAANSEEAQNQGGGSPAVAVGKSAESQPQPANADIGTEPTPLADIGRSLADDGLSALLAAGTHCPDCGT